MHLLYCPCVPDMDNPLVGLVLQSVVLVIAGNSDLSIRVFQDVSDG